MQEDMQVEICQERRFGNNGHRNVRGGDENKARRVGSLSGC